MADGTSGFTDTTTADGAAGAVIRQTLAEHMKKSDLASNSSQVLLLSVEDESGAW